MTAPFDFTEISSSFSNGDDTLSPDHAYISTKNYEITNLNKLVNKAL